MSCFSDSDLPGYVNFIRWLLLRDNRRFLLKGRIEDAIQDILLKLFVAHERLGKLDFPRAFIRGIVRYYFLEKGRKYDEIDKVTDLIPDFDNLDTDDPEIRSIVKKIREVLSSNQTDPLSIAMINDCMENLTVQERFCLVAKFVEGRTYIEIAQLFTFTYVTARARALKGVRKIAECLSANSN